MFALILGGFGIRMNFIMSQKLEILLVDDDKFVLEFVKSIIDKDLYNVTDTIDPILALDIIEEKRPDIIISDIMMPGISGMELLRRVKKIDRNIPVIFITSYADLDMAMEAIEAGALDFIKKPVQEDILKNALEKALKSISSLN